MATIAKIIGTASIRLTLDNKGFTAAVQAAVREAAAAARAKIDFDVDGDAIKKKTEDATRKSKPKIKADLDPDIFKKLSGLSSAVNNIPKLALGVSNAASIASGISGITSAVSQLSGVVALVPAGLLAAGVGFATLAIGTKGFGDALKAVGDPAKFNEAIKGLAPSARDAAQAVQGLQPAWKSLQLDVQQRLFDGLGTRIKDLGKNFLPTLKAGLGGVATELNGGVKLWADWANQGAQVSKLQGMLGSIRQFFANLAPAGRDFAAALTDIASVGSGFLPSFGTGIANVAARFREFIEASKNSGALKTFIQTGITAFGQLFTIIKNIISIAGQLFSGLQLEGGGFLTTLVNLTTTMKNFLASAQGQETLKSLGTVLSTISTTVGTVFNAALKAIGPIIVAIAPFIEQLIQAIGTKLTGAIQTVGPILLGLANFLSQNADVIVPLVLGLSSLIKIMSGVGSAIKLVKDGMQTYRDIMASTVLKTIAGWISMAAQAVASAAVIVGGWISTAAQAVASVAVQVGQWLLLGAQATLGAAKVAAAWVLQKLEAAGALLAQIPVFAAIVAGWVAMGVESLIRAAQMAAAWLIALGPIGWIIAAVVGLVALIIANWDTVKQTTIDVWNTVWKWISDRITDVSEWVGGRIRDILSFFDWLGELPGRVARWFGSVKDGAVQKLNELLDWIKGVPGWILDRLGDLGNLLVQAGKSILEGFLRGLKNVWNDITDFVGGIGRWISDHKGPISYDRQLLVPAGLAIMGGLHEGLQAGFQPIMDSVASMGDSLVNAFGAPVLGAGMNVNDLQVPSGATVSGGGATVQPVLNQYNIMQPGTDVKQFSQTVLQRGMSDFLNGASTLSVSRQGVQQGVNDLLVNGVAR